MLSASLSNSLISTRNCRWSAIAVNVNLLSSSSEKYNHNKVEPKWQQFWDDNKTFAATRRVGHKKKYVLDMFPYPSGSGLHVGHPEGYTATDIMARYWRMQDYDVLHPMGWDSFGLPAEQHALNTGTHPAVTTNENIRTFKRQLKSLGFSYDWDRELATTDKDYVRWTQSIFLKLYHKGIAHQGEYNVNWCPALGTVLANEEVNTGVSERGGHPVIRQPIRQWVLKISEYADKLNSTLHELDWPEGTISSQKQWIGQSDGASVRFPIKPPSEGTAVDIPDHIEVFTTRPETIMGVSYLVIAPENPLVRQLVSVDQQEAVDQYVTSIASKTDLERTSTGKDKGKSGVFLGAYAVHPMYTSEGNGEMLLPIWVADYVLAGYGSGAVMSVPAHDERDHVFAKLFDLPIRHVIRPPCPDGEKPIERSDCVYTGDGEIENSGEWNGMLSNSTECKERVYETLSSSGVGNKKTMCRLRDWIFSRQRYWGEPIPIYFPVHAAGDSPDASTPFDPRLDHEHSIDYDTPIAMDDSELPLILPDMTDFHPGDNPQGCLAKAKEWRYFHKNVEHQDGTRGIQWYARETNTMPQWAGSCWYYLRYIDPKNTSEMFSKDAASWLPVDLYVGGKEHAVLHLLYARFWHKVLYDLGEVDYPEPFPKLVHQGMILGTDGEKMSKSRGNVINPDDIIREHGADVLRLYEMFMGPLEATKPWQTDKVIGMVRFRDRIHQLMFRQSVVVDDAAVQCGGADSPVKLHKIMHKTIKQVTDHVEHMRFNTAISCLMIFLNELTVTAKEQSVKSSNKSSVKYGQSVPAGLPVDAVEAFVLMLSPFAPHIAEECWQHIHGSDGSKTITSLANEPWPTYIDSYTQENNTKLAVQINGRFRGTLETIEHSTTQERILELVWEDEKLSKWLPDPKGSNLNAMKIVYVKGKVLNIVLTK